MSVIRILSTGNEKGQYGPDVATDALHREVTRRIDQACRRKKWSRNQLADFAGISRGSVSMIMNGINSPSLRTIARIADALGVEIVDLIPRSKK
jgi:transcriptional regulator with XRE-family HTH domain